MKQPPTEEVIKMRKKNVPDDKIVDELKNKKYGPEQINDAMQQANIKTEVNTHQPSPQGYEGSMLDQEIPIPEPPKEEAPKTYSAPATQQPQFQPSQPITPQYQATSEELVEAIIDEKWQQLISNIGDIEIWKSRTNDDIESIKQEILRLSERFDKLQSSVLGKVTEYSRSITNINSELKALEKVMQNIMQPLTTNIKELSNVTQELKKRAKS